MDGRSGRAAFTLMELLAVVAVIAILLALLVPVLGRARTSAVRTACSSNLKQVHVICTLWASEHDGMVPVSDSGNPSQFSGAPARELAAFMKAAGISPEAWFCPGIGSQSSARVPANWGVNNRYVLGYFYNGNPSLGDNADKYVHDPYPGRGLVADALLAFDYCATARPSPTRAEEVASWLLFPHFDRMQALKGDGSVSQRHVKDMQLEFKFEAAVNVYW